jgi:spore coat protein H
MTGKSMRVYLKILVLLFVVSSCYQETVLVPDQEKGILNFIMDSLQEDHINKIRGMQYEVINPIPVLKYYGQSYKMDKLEIRGDNTLNFRRKGYSVNLDSSLNFYIKEERKERKFEEFKLLALVYDYTYFEYYTAINLFKEVGLWPVYSYLTEVQINGHTQGIYLFIEDPAEYCIKKLNASIFIRRGYYHSFKSMDINPSLSPDSVAVYTGRFNKIYSDIVLYSGKQLYDSLAAIIDLENYFTKISVDLLLKNGDYNDEIFFYTMKKDGKELFRVIPWDLDDLFSELPHEIGRSWALTTLFGNRIYNSMEDIYADVGHKLIFSIEDDLDYKIAKDEYMYSEYLKTLSNVINVLDENTIDQVVNNTENSLMPFYTNDSIIAQSRYDIDETNFQLFSTNIAEKRRMLKERRKWILDELNKNN